MTDWLKDNPFAVIGEMIRILPDALVFTSGFFSILTSSFPNFVFFLSLLESVGIFYILRKLPFLENSKGSPSAQCRSGFYSATFSSLSLFKLDKSAFPSVPIYMTSVAASYLINSLSNQMTELELLGTEFVFRYYLSLVSLFLFLFFISCYRMYNNCDSMLVILTSIAAGIAIGMVLVMQNNSLLGPNSVNLTGIPLLKNKTATGEQIYICSKSSS
jgi:uncharacterized membrane protein